MRLTDTRAKRLGIAAAVGLVLAGLAVWWFVLRSDAPPPVALSEAVGSVSTTSTTSAGEPDRQSPSGAVDLTGTWTLDAGAGSFVGYRVEEELARIGFTEAVGRTSAVTGTLEIADGELAAVAVEADLTQLRSDSSSRDNQMRRQGLETDAFPTASFVLTSPVTLEFVDAEQPRFSGSAAGELTIHGVTRPVEIPLEAELAGEVIVVVGSLPIEFADYDIDPPTSFAVLSVEDNGVMEFQLFFAR